MAAFIDDYRTVHDVGPICEVLPIAPSTYYAFKARQEDASRRSTRAQRDETLCDAMQQVWNDYHQVYGARKVWLQLCRDGWPVARCIVERLMRDLALQDPKILPYRMARAVGAPGFGTCFQVQLLDLLLFNVYTFIYTLIDESSRLRLG